MLFSEQSNKECGGIADSHGFCAEDTTYVKFLDIFVNVASWARSVRRDVVAVVRNTTGQHLVSRGWHPAKLRRHDLWGVGILKLGAPPEIGNRSAFTCMGIPMPWQMQTHPHHGHAEYAYFF